MSLFYIFKDVRFLYSLMPVNEDIFMFDRFSYVRERFVGSFGVGIGRWRSRDDFLCGFFYYFEFRFDFII